MNDVHIDPALIPEVEWDMMCRTLADCIKRAMADPKLRAEYEAWAAEN